MLQALSTATNTQQIPIGSEGGQGVATTGATRVAQALQPGHEAVQDSLRVLQVNLEHLKLNMSEGERAALQMHVSQFSALVTLAINVSSNIGKSLEKLQQ